MDVDDLSVLAFDNANVLKLVRGVRVYRVQTAAFQLTTSPVAATTP